MKEEKKSAWVRVGLSVLMSAVERRVTVRGTRSYTVQQKNVGHIETQNDK